MLLRMMLLEPQSKLPARRGVGQPVRVGGHARPGTASAPASTDARTGRPARQAVRDRWPGRAGPSAAGPLPVEALGPEDVAGVVRRGEHRVGELLLPGGEVELGRRPVELVGDVVVVVRRRRRCRRPRWRRWPGWPWPRPRRSGPRSRHRSANAASYGANSRAHWAAVAARFSVAAVDGGCSSRGCGSSLRQQRQAGPVVVVHLVVRHAGQRLAGRHLHAQQELQLPAGLVEDVRHAVAALGQVQRRVAERGRLGGRGDLGPLERAQQLVDRDAAVDHVLAVVARVVPAAADVERVVADARAGTGTTRCRPGWARRRRDRPAGRTRAAGCPSIAMPLRWV